MSLTAFSGAGPICRKEFTHIARDRATLFFALLMPMMQLVLFGLAIDTNVRQIPTIVLDLEKTEQSRRLLDRFVNSDTFDIVAAARSDNDVYQAIRRGEANVGIKIPVDYSRSLATGQQTAVLVLVDGSNSSVTSQAVNVSNAILLQEALRQSGGARSGRLPVEARPAVLYNPGTRSPNFFVPGMIAVVVQIMLIMLVAFSIVRERERGTLDQLSLTPLAPLGLMVGKMAPYGLLGFLELCAILLVMRLVFQVPIQGSLPMLLLLSLPFLLTVLGIGLLISARARTQPEAFQLAIGTVLPSVFLSGYIFLIENMPVPFQVISQVLPATHYISILRGVILRGAGIEDTWRPALALLAMGSVAIALAAVQFTRRRVT